MIQQAKTNKVPHVTLDWAIQCIIEGAKLPFEEYKLLSFDDIPQSKVNTLP
jgi:hypothetical protein